MCRAVQFYYYLFTCPSNYLSIVIFLILSTTTGSWLSMISVTRWSECYSKNRPTFYRSHLIYWLLYGTRCSLAQDNCQLQLADITQSYKYPSLVAWQQYCMPSILSPWMYDIYQHMSARTALTCHGAQYNFLIQPPSDFEEAVSNSWCASIHSLIAICINGEYFYCLCIGGYDIYCIKYYQGVHRNPVSQI